MTSAALISTERMRPCAHMAAQDDHVQQIRTLQVIDILAFAAKEAQILHAFDRAADERVQLAHDAALAADLETR